jgi:hypothetical protein
VAIFITLYAVYLLELHLIHKECLFVKKKINNRGMSLHGHKILCFLVLTTQSALSYIPSCFGRTFSSSIGKIAQKPHPEHPFVAPGRKEKQLNTLVIRPEEKH